jgi:hypothetical protein
MDLFNFLRKKKAGNGINRYFGLVNLTNLMPVHISSPISNGSWTSISLFTLNIDIEKIFFVYYSIAGQARTNSTPFKPHQPLPLLLPSPTGPRPTTSSGYPTPFRPTEASSPILFSRIPRRSLTPPSLLCQLVIHVSQQVLDS